MSFYDIPKEDRIKLVEQIRKDILSDVQTNKSSRIALYFSDEDTYIRKSAYMAIGKIAAENPALQKDIISILERLLEDPEFKARQSVINAAGEIGMKHFEPVEHFFDKGLFDEHHAIRNAVIGSIKKMGEKNPQPVLQWAKKYLHHPDKEIRREICHGIELRGRTHPRDILPLLKELQNDTTARVRNTLIHVLGQVSYKKGCLETVIADLNTWENKELTGKAIEEIIDVHHRYRDFAVHTPQEALDYIDKNYKA